MEDKNKEYLGGEASAETAFPADTSAAETGAADAPLPKISEGLKKALIRCGIALVVVIALLAATHFSIAAIIRGPANTSSISSEKEGAFVRRDIYAIVGYSDSDKSGETVVGQYAVVPMDGKFVVVHLPRRFLSSADAVLEETNNYIADSSSATLDKYFVVDGTVAKLSDAEQKKLAAWYTSNKDALVKNHVIDETADESAYLSDITLEVDRIDGMSEITVIVLSGIAGVFLLYIIVELILMASGFYLDERAKARLAEADGLLAKMSAAASDDSDADTADTADSAEAADDSAEAAAADGSESAEAPADSQPEGRE